MENKDSGDFSIANIPFGVISTLDNLQDQRPATRLGNSVYDLRAIEQKGLFSGAQYAEFKKQNPQGTLFAHPTLNTFMDQTRPLWTETRLTLIKLLEAKKVEDCAIDVSKTVNHMPAKIGDYTDFYSSKNHAYNVGVMFRGKDNALQPNWTWLPVGYHGRASTVCISGQDVVRPRGQTKPPNAELPSFTECKRLDFELEIGAFVGGPKNKLGTPVKIDNAEDRIFGLVLMNDWSARDIQAWEYVPLGPFNAKNFLTTISPWIVTLDALEPFRVTLPEQDPKPMKYLDEKHHSSFDINLDVYIKVNGTEDVLSKSNYKYMYWSAAQQLAHHSVTGCEMNGGDLLGSGTISGTEKTEYGSLLELSWSGKEPINLPNSGQTRTFIQDGDEIIMRGFAQSEKGRVGFGECNGKILPALPEDNYYQVNKSKL